MTPLTRQACNYWPMDPQNIEERRQQILALFDRAEAAERERDAAMRVADDWRDKAEQLRRIAEEALAQRDAALAALSATEPKP